MKPQDLVERGRFLGEEFLLWLWMRGLTEGGTSSMEGDQSAFFLDDSVQLVTEKGDVKELSLRKGNPAESKEAFDALARGMRLAKAKVRILSGDMEWVCTLSSSTLDTSAMKLPPSQAKDLQGRASDRLFLIEEGIGHLERRYGIFLKIRTETEDALKEQIDAWIRQGVQVENPSASPDDVPWQGN